MARPRIALRGVRARLTIGATAVAVLAVCAAGLWLVHAVESSLNRQIAADEQNAIALIADALKGSDASGAIDPALMVEVASTGQSVQVLDASGDVVASSLSPAGNVTVAGTGVTPSAAGDQSVRRATVNVGASRFTIVVSSPLQPMRQSVRAVTRALLVVLPVLVAAVALLTWFLAGRALRPVEAIRGEVERIGAATLRNRVPAPGTGDEVDRLAATMNAMLDRIESASVRQQQFVADASHELRSPVTAIRTQLEVARHIGAPTDWEAMIDEMLAEEARLEATISDLLLSASLDEGAPIPNAEAVDFGQVVDAIVARSPRGGPLVTRSGEPGGVATEVYGSRVQLERAIGNLVDNASRFASSTVAVSVDAADGVVVICVDDDGPGIAEGDRERIFERFTRLDDHRARSATGAGGAGLGLALVRQIATRHGGEVHVEDAPSGGARFVLTLPAAPQR